GGVVLGRMMDKFGNFVVIGTAYVFAALFVGAVGLVTFSPPLLMAMLALAGACTVGTQVCGNALAASLYPTAMRATGVGWAYGIGRVGSIVGPVVGGILITQQWDMRSLFLIAAVPLACAAVALAGLGYVSHDRVAATDLAASQ
ncbi:MAG: MFS transporter, partial [Xanthobacteraceae bacterium]